MTAGKKITHLPAKATEKPQASAVTPFVLLERAVASNADIAVMERLMDLHERWQANQAKMAFAEAISSAKAEIKPIRKNRKVDFTSQKGRTNYEYEDLAEVAKSVDPIIARYGLSYRFRSRQEGKKVTVTCVLAHRDGYSEENELSADNDETGNKNSIQAIGSTLTYLQRMTLKLALGLAAAKDDDAKAAGAAAKISEEQLNELIAIADDVNANKIAFCKYFRIETMQDLPSAQFEKAKAALNSKRQASNDSGE